jgi:hypothetical protein
MLLRYWRWVRRGSTGGAGMKGLAGSPVSSSAVSPAELSSAAVVGGGSALSAAPAELSSPSRAASPA